MLNSRKRRASRELQIETEISDLPDEILMKIFQFLYKDDLLALTLQNKRFNQIISDGLMDKISLFISPQSLEADWIGSRQYTRVYFCESCTEENLMEFANILINIGSSIKKLTIENLKINPYTLKVILGLCKNLKVLILPELLEKLEEYEVFWRNLPSLDLTELRSYDYGPLPLLLASNTKSLTLQHGDDYDRVYLENFLKVQKKLEFLALMGNREYHELFNTPVLNTVEFRLKTLELSNLTIENSQNFKAFIDNHADTLTHVKLNKVSSLSILNSFENVKKIKKLTFHTKFSIHPQDCDVRANVDELDFSAYFSAPSTIELASIFPNLRKMKVTLSVFFQTSLTLGKFQKLTHLYLVGRTINDLSISAPTKFVRIANYTFDKMPHFEEFQFEVIKLIKCNNVNWLAEFLAMDETRVKNLTFKDMELSSKVLKVIEANRSKIENIKFL